ncbi:MAG: LuxR C-terminal-related transcriptional regulator [Reichenbachiella sp.]|uniref:LuxR C-terminal-related transcriptional regulator n=1 Tax=Reichenbachiella sp. TaxID=2184521 RepID=UPI0032654157
MLNTEALSTNSDSISNGVFPKVTLEVFDRFSSTVLFYFNTQTEELIYVSDSVRATNGYSPQDFFSGGMDFLKTLVHEEDYPVVLGEYLNLLNESRNRSRTLELRLRHAQGHWVWHEVDMIVFTDSDQSNRLFGMAKKISKTMYKDSSNADENRVCGQMEKKQMEEYCHSVTRREREVLHLIADGLSAKQLADKLYISVHTAINHRKNLISKLHVKNTAELIKVASTYFQL